MIVEEATEIALLRYDESFERCSYTKVGRREASAMTAAAAVTAANITVQ